MLTSDQRERCTDGVLLFGCGPWPRYGEPGLHPGGLQEDGVRFGLTPEPPLREKAALSTHKREALGEE